MPGFLFNLDSLVQQTAPPFYFLWIRLDMAATNRALIGFWISFPSLEAFPVFIMGEAFSIGFPESHLRLRAVPFRFSLKS